ncbi:YdhK family protein [Chryseomicrobium sp. FSL W7-1435]|uniref:YdhK family protein n=1 Tax=Chryseomicrobium sp. FSL W7-1435 TaxID=2921704 RepID=UPI00315A5D70
MKKWLISFTAVLFVLSGCSSNESHEGHSSEEMDHAGHGSSDGMLPEGLKDAENPKFPVDSDITIAHGHMDGMEGAVGKVVGAYDTTAYIVTYESVESGEVVEDHKWVIHEELVEADQEEFSAGDEVTLDADHLEGMKGATATIDEARETVVYMIDYTTTDGDEITNHKWVTEDELSLNE